MLQHYARQADLSQAATTSLDPASSKPVAGLSRALRFFERLLDPQSVIPTKEIDLLHNQQHVRAWDRVIRTGWLPLETSGHLNHLTEHHASLLTRLFKLTALEIQQCVKHQQDHHLALNRFRSIVQLLVETTHRDGSVTCADHYLNGILSDWAWSGLSARDSAARDVHASLVVDLWHLLRDITQPPSQGSSSGVKASSFKLRLPQQLHEAVLTAASLLRHHPHPSSLDLRSFLIEYASATTITSLKDSRLYSNAHAPRTDAILTNKHAFNRSERRAAYRWIQHADLSLLWAVGGSMGLQQRIRRWADRHDLPLVLRTLDLVLDAATSKTDQQAWMSFDWSEADHESSRLPSDSSPQQDASEDEPKRAKFGDTLQTTPGLFGSFIVSLMRLGETSRVAVLWQDLQSKGLPLVDTLWSALVAGHMQRDNPAGVQAVLDQMEAAGVPLTPEMHALHARALLRAHDLQGGMTKILWMIDHFRPLPTGIYKQMLNDMIRRGQFSRAVNLLYDMDRSQIDASVLNPFITFYCKQGLATQGYERSLELLDQFGVQPDAVTHSILLDGALKSKRQDEALRWLTEMTKDGSSGLAGTRVHSSIISHLAHSGSPDLLQQALNLLRVLENTNPKVLNEVVYADVVQALCEQADFGLAEGDAEASSMPPNIREAQALISRMRSRGVIVSSPTYNALISAYVSLGSRAGALQALRTLKESRESQRSKAGYDFVHPTTWRTLLFGLERGEHWDLAKQVTQEMALLGFQPHGPLAALVDRVKAH